LEVAVTTDDITSLAAISFGTLLAIAATVSSTASDSVVPEQAAIAPPAIPSATPEPTPVIDFAIIREPIELMVGPEGPASGWSPSEDLRTGQSPRR
jgi:hypothetical protein